MEKGLTGARAHATLPETLAVNLPTRLLEFTRRLASLGDGRYVVTLTVRHRKMYWTVNPLGNVEKNAFASQSAEE